MRLRSRARWSVLACTVGLALAGCTDDGGATAGTPGGDEGEPTPAGLEGCRDDPNGCNGGEPVPGGTITWLVDGTPDAWASFASEGDTAATRQVLHGVLPFTGQWAPDRTTYVHNTDLLAAEPELVGEDPVQVRFRLREEAVWDDGTPITARDFEVSWKLATDEAEGHCLDCQPGDSQRYDAIASVVGEDDGRSVIVTLDEGTADPEWFGLFGADAAGGGLVPAHVGEEQGFDVDDPEGLGAYSRYLHGTVPSFSGGPYRIAEGDLAAEVVKVANPAWYGEEVALDTLTLRFVTDPDAIVPAVRDGEVQGGSPARFDAEVVADLSELPDVAVLVQPGPSWSHLDVDLTEGPLADVALRRAIFTAVDVDRIGERQYGEAFPAWTRRRDHVFAEGSPFAVDHLAGTGQGSGDAAAARAILDDHGYVLEDAILTRDGEPIGPLRLRGGDTEPITIALEEIRVALAELGIEADVEPTDELGATLAAGDYDLIVFESNGGPVPVASARHTWHRDGGGNFGGYADGEVDRLVEAIGRRTDLADAAELASDATARVVDAAYVLPLTETPVYTFVDRRYVGVRDHAHSHLRALYNLWEWGLADG